MSQVDKLTYQSIEPMTLEAFESGVHRQQYEYKSFTPALVNHGWSWDDPKVNTLLERAIRALGQLDAFTQIVPDVDLFIQMHVMKEARDSSAIEGTQTEMQEAVLVEDEILPERRDDWNEVQNYVRAMNWAIAALGNLPLSNRLLCKTHEILLDDVRGEHKLPGEFRRSQNWIGGSNLSDAVYIPPVQTDVPDLMSDLQKFWHNEQIDVPHLIRIAISHYQFESIHPFSDGNGRIGRLLITLYLIDKKYLHKPSLYLSDFFERNRGAYYDALTVVRMSNNLLHWVKFFLNAVIETADKSRRTFEKILELRNKTEDTCMGLGRRAGNARQILHRLYRKPVITSKEVQAEIGVTPKSANDLIKLFVDSGILVTLDDRVRNRLFCFLDYLLLFQTKR